MIALNFKEIMMEIRELSKYNETHEDYENGENIIRIVTTGQSDQIVLNLI